jgi:hypothetical protein
MGRLLQENDLFDLSLLTEYVFRQLNSNSKMFNYSAPIINDDDKKFDLENGEDKQENDNRKIINAVNANKQLIDGDVADEEDKNDNKTAVVRGNLNGIKAFDEIESCRRDSYFKLKINESYKYIHKQSAC